MPITTFGSGRRFFIDSNLPMAKEGAKVVGGRGITPGMAGLPSRMVRAVANWVETSLVMVSKRGMGAERLRRMKP